MLGSANYHDALRVLVDAIGMMAIVGLLCNPALSRLGPSLACWASGLAMGGIAILHMSTPIVIAPGVIVDLRNLPIALAAAFFGPRGLIPALLLGAGYRLWLGGAGAPAGIFGMALAGLGGLFWAWLGRDVARRGLRWLLLLGVISSVHLLSAFLIPAGPRAIFIAECAPVLFLLNVIGSLVVGGLIEQHNGHLTRIDALKATAMNDPETGLLSPAGFARRIAAHQADQTAPACVGAVQIRLRHLDWIARTHGPDAQRRVLEQMGARLARLRRSGDFALRPDRNRLAMLLPDIGETGMARVIEQIREDLGHRPVRLGNRKHVRLQIDLATSWTPGTLDAPQVLAEAHAALCPPERHAPMPSLVTPQVALPVSAVFKPANLTVGSLFDTTETMMARIHTR